MRPVRAKEAGRRGDAPVPAWRDRGRQETPSSAPGRGVLPSNPICRMCGRPITADCRNCPHDGR